MNSNLNKNKNAISNYKSLKNEFLIQKFMKPKKKLE